MNMENREISIIDNIMPLLCEIVDLNCPQISYGQVLKAVNKHITTGVDYIDKLCKILRSWGIKSELKAVSYDELIKSENPTLMIFLEGAVDYELPEVKLYILASKQEAGITVYDTDKGYLYLSEDELKYCWFNTVISLDFSSVKHSLINVDSKINDDPGGVSVIMPIFNQASFVCGAINSLFSQNYKKWELIIIDDGSTDDVYRTIQPFLNDERINYFRNKKNEGLGYSLNEGIKKSSYDAIAYLPADDLYFNNHLESLMQAYLATDALLIYSGMTYDFNQIERRNYGYKITKKNDHLPLQLVQVMHRKKRWKWTERREFVTDNLSKMYWHYFEKYKNKVIGTHIVTCEWGSHKNQRHKIINERKGGGIFRYKEYYHVTEPLRFKSSSGNFIDEIEWYSDFRKISVIKQDKNLKILFVGELAYNPERVLAFEERGHQLYGLWVTEPSCINTVGPLPFGNITDITSRDWQKCIEKIKPDIIYGLLNFHAVNLAYDVLKRELNIPFVWHFKEGPFFCKDHGLWDKLIYLYTHSAGKIYNNEVVREWFRMYVPADHSNEFILDGDLPKKERFYDKKSPLLSDVDGEIHTVVAGRPVGISAMDIKQMVDQKIHMHIYGDIFHVQFKKLIERASSAVGDYLHLHPNCPQSQWVEEFSQYDAGWLHYFESENYGDLKKASWHDLNSPARMSTYAMAGLPMLLRDNVGHKVASQELLEEKGMALKFSSFTHLHHCFENRRKLLDIRANVWRNRLEFSFDHYIDDLIAFFIKFQ